ncbi:MAG: hypothetical protein RLZZ436_440 [Planctomycetota bacterium]|jgi:hypothetical protein
MSEKIHHGILACFTAGAVSKGGIMSRLAAGLVLSLAVALISSPSASAQGLIFQLPEDSRGVEYQGTLTQGTSADDENALTWTCELTIKSVGREDAEFEGQVQPCRWIEIKTITGQAGEAGIDPGPVGARIYKVLVPESKVIGESRDSSGIANDMLPIVRGFRRLGEEGVEPIRTPALRFYPTIALLTSYPDPEVIATNAVPEIILQGQQFSAVHRKGRVVMESQKTRSTNEGEYWVSKDIPFGLARWTVTVTSEEKDLAAPRTEFRTTVVKKVDMKLRQIRENVESELVTQ